MRCLVTGGAGFIGSHLTEALVKQGHDVVVLDNLSTGKRENLSSVINKIEFVEGDITDNQILNQVMPGIECIFHYAALASVSISFQNPHLNFDTNISGTAKILQCALENQVKKVIFSSSASVYDADNIDSKDESAAIAPKSPYAYSKLVGEQLCEMYQNVFDMDITIFRFFNVYGSRQSANSQYSGVITCFIDRILQKESLLIYGDGYQTRDFIHVHDIVSASILVLNSSKSGTYNIGYGKSHRILDIAMTLQNLVDPGIKAEFRAERRGDPRHSLSDISKIKENLGFVPKVAFKDGLKEVWEWARTQTMTAPSYQSISKT